MTILLPMLLAAAAVAPATPIEPGEWFTSKEYSKTALKVAERGPIAYMIDVAPDGTAVRCVTQENSELDHKVCEIVMKRARFTPATDDQGRPTWGVHDGLASFLMPGKNGRPDRSKFVVTLDRLPDGVTSPAYAKVAFKVDRDGTVSHCASTVGERRRFMQTLEALGPAACANLAKAYRPVIARNVAGDALASVQTVLVRFEMSKAP